MELFATMPAPLELGLLKQREMHFTLRPGSYPIESTFLTMKFLALARVPSLEVLRYDPPGEWGKILGLDPVPAVKTLRGKPEELTADEAKVRQWSSTLGQQWMEAEGGVGAFSAAHRHRLWGWDRVDLGRGDR